MAGDSLSEPRNRQKVKWTNYLVSDKRLWIEMYLRRDCIRGLRAYGSKSNQVSCWP